MASNSDVGLGNAAGSSFEAYDDDAQQHSNDPGELATAFSEDLKRVGEVTRQQAQRALEVANQQVRANPTTALALAASFGLLIGMLFAKR